MKYRSNTISKKAVLTRELSSALKDRIKQLDLIDTGEMLNSTSVVIDFTIDGLDIQVNSTDYYKYVDGKYNITDYVLDSRHITNLIEELYGEMIVDMFMMD